MKTSFLLLTALLAACSSQQKQEVYYGNGYMWQEYVDQKLKQCHDESATLTLMMFEADQQSLSPRLRTKEDVEKLERMLKDSCVKYYKITI